MQIATLQTPLGEKWITNCHVYVIIYIWKQFDRARYWRNTFICLERALSLTLFLLLFIKYNQLVKLGKRSFAFLFPKCPKIKERLSFWTYIFIRRLKPLSGTVALLVFVYLVFDLITNLYSCERRSPARVQSWRLAIIRGDSSDNCGQHWKIPSGVNYTNVRKCGEKHLIRFCYDSGSHKVAIITFCKL